MNWKHPATLLVLTTLVSAIGWILTSLWTNWDRSDLRVEIEGLRQGIALVSNIQPKIENENVYFDTANFSLVLAHNRKGNAPIVINGISIRTEALQPDNLRPTPPGIVDVLSARPYGIAEKKTFNVTLLNKEITVRYIESAANEGAWSVSPDNLLTGADNKKLIITLKPEDPASVAISVSSKRTDICRIWFVIDYDANGSRSRKSSSFLISK